MIESTGWYPIGSPSRSHYFLSGWITGGEQVSDQDSCETYLNPREGGAGTWAPGRKAWRWPRGRSPQTYSAPERGAR
jgi:hypothetical protein